MKARAHDVLTGVLLGLWAATAVSLPLIILLKGCGW